MSPSRSSVLLVSTSSLHTMDHGGNRHQEARPRPGDRGRGHRTERGLSQEFPQLSMLRLVLSIWPWTLEEPRVLAFWILLTRKVPGSAVKPQPKCPPAAWENREARESVSWITGAIFPSLLLHRWSENIGARGFEGDTRVCVSFAVFFFSSFAVFPYVPSFG